MGDTDKHVSSPLSELKKQLDSSAAGHTVQQRLLKRRQDEQKLSDVHVRDELNETLRRLEGAAIEKGAENGKLLPAQQCWQKRKSQGKGTNPLKKRKKQRRQEAKTAYLLET